MVELDFEVHFGSFELDTLPRPQSRLLKLKLHPFTSEVRLKYTFDLYDHVVIFLMNHFSLRTADASVVTHL